MPDPRDFLPPPPWEGPPVPRAFIKALTNPKQRFPITHIIYVQKPPIELGIAKWESYKRWIEYMAKHKLRVRSTGLDFVVIWGLRTQAEVDEMKSLVESYGLKVLRVAEIEEVPDEED